MKEVMEIIELWDRRSHVAWKIGTLTLKHALPVVRRKFLPIDNFTRTPNVPVALRVVNA